MYRNRTNKTATLAFIPSMWFSFPELKSLLVRCFLLSRFAMIL